MTAAQDHFNQYCAILKGVILDHPDSAIAPALELLLRQVRILAIDDAGLTEANHLLDDLSRSLWKPQITPTRTVKAEDLKPGMIIALQGYWYIVERTRPEEVPNGWRQISKLRWAGFGAMPIPFFQHMDHGLTHGYNETVLDLPIATGD